MWRKLGRKLVDFMKNYRYNDGRRLFEYLSDRDDMHIRFGTGNAGEFPAVWVLFGEENSVKKQDAVTGGTIQYWIDIYANGQASADIPIGEYLYNQAERIENELLKVFHDEFIPKVQRELGLGLRAKILAILSDGDESMNINNIQQRIVLEIEWYK